MRLSIYIIVVILLLILTLYSLFRRIQLNVVHPRQICFDGKMNMLGPVLMFHFLFCAFIIYLTNSSSSAIVNSLALNFIFCGLLCFLNLYKKAYFSTSALVINFRVYKIRDLKQLEYRDKILKFEYSPTGKTIKIPIDNHYYNEFIQLVAKSSSK